MTPREPGQRVVRATEKGTVARHARVAFDGYHCNCTGARACAGYLLNAIT
jgi:hypothetical protein